MSPQKSCPLTIMGIVCLIFLALFGSLQAIEIAAWYMTPETQFCALRTPATLNVWRLFNNLPKSRWDYRFRSCFWKDRARNPLDIFNIWQHVAWKSRQLLIRQFPTVISDIILNSWFFFFVQVHWKQISN